MFLKLAENAKLSREWIAVETFRKLSRNFYRLRKSALRR